MSMSKIAGQPPKSDVVREILNKLGFAEANPPDDWHSRTQAELARKGLSVHSTTIYQIRLEELRRKGIKRPAPKFGRKPMTQDMQPLRKPDMQPLRKPDMQPLQNQRRSVDDDVLASVTLREAVAVRDFAKDYGGINRLNAVVQVLLSMGGN